MGVVGAVRHDSLSVPPMPEVYVPLEQRIVFANSLVVRAAGDVTTLAPAVRRTINDLDPEVAISHLMSLQDLVAESVARRRVVLLLLGAFALVGLLLGSIGIYGVVAYAARMREKEIGIRLALGARPAAVVQLMLRQGAPAVLGGLLAGVIAALLATRVLRGLLFGVATTDPFTFALVPILLAAVACAAMLLPARRAARSDPNQALRD